MPPKKNKVVGPAAPIQEPVLRKSKRKSQPALVEFTKSNELLTVSNIYNYIEYEGLEKLVEGHLYTVYWGQNDKKREECEIKIHKLGGHRDDLTYTEESLLNEDDDDTNKSDSDSSDIVEAPAKKKKSAAKKNTTKNLDSSILQLENTSTTLCKETKDTRGLKPFVFPKQISSATGFQQMFPITKPPNAKCKLQLNIGPKSKTRVSTGNSNGKTSEGQKDDREVSDCNAVSKQKTPHLPEAAMPQHLNESTRLQETGTPRDAANVPDTSLTVTNVSSVQILENTGGRGKPLTEIHNILPSLNKAKNKKELKEILRQQLLNLQQESDSASSGDDLDAPKSSTENDPTLLHVENVVDNHGDIAPSEVDNTSSAVDNTPSAVVSNKSTDDDTSSSEEVFEASKSSRKEDPKFSKTKKVYPLLKDSPRQAEIFDGSGVYMNASEKAHALTTSKTPESLARKILRSKFGTKRLSEMSACGTKKSGAADRAVMLAVENLCFSVYKKTFPFNKMFNSLCGNVRKQYRQKAGYYKKNTGNQHNNKEDNNKRAPTRTKVARRMLDSDSDSTIAEKVQDIDNVYNPPNVVELEKKDDKVVGVDRESHSDSFSEYEFISPRGPQSTLTQVTTGLTPSGLTPIDVETVIPPELNSQHSSVRTKIVTSVPNISPGNGIMTGSKDSYCSESVAALSNIAADPLPVSNINSPAPLSGPSFSFPMQFPWGSQPYEYPNNVCQPLNSTNMAHSQPVNFEQINSMIQTLTSLTQQFQQYQYAGPRN